MSAKAVDPRLYRTRVEFDTVRGKKCVQWYLIDCETEQQAVTVADRVVKEIWTECYE